ncbi:unnamed protein product [Rotaria sp. Silwood1]|nr:unnamed protein product [Rotaria sp. Silwood1]
MSQSCAVYECKRASRALCHCCQQNLCIPHLTEHNDLLNAQLNPLIDEVNSLGDRLKTVDIQEKTRQCRQKLEQWRIDCHQQIDSVFEKKCQQLNQLVEEKVEKQRQEVTRIQSKLSELIQKTRECRQKLEQWRIDCHQQIDSFFEEKRKQLNQLVEKKVEKQRQEITRIQSKLSELIREQEATRQDIDILTSTISHLQNKMSNIEQSSIHINIRPLVIDTNCIRINDTNYHGFDSSILSPIYKTINCADGTFRALASNDQYLLFHDAPNLCLLDQNLTVVRKNLWDHGNIFDMCWSSTLKQFIVIEQNDIYLVNENTMSIERIETIKKEKWMSCTCSDTSLFLSTRVYGSSILEFSLLPAINLIRELKYPDSCMETELITCIEYNNETLALLIRNHVNKTMRIELKSSITFDHIWSLQLDIVWNKEKTIRCCSLIDDEWLIADHENNRLIHVSKGGTVKTMLTYTDTPWFVNLFGSDMLIVSLVTFRLNFHKLNNDF